MDIPGKAPAPLDLGRSGWDILHSSAAVYPYKPNPRQEEAMRNFILSWSELYACSWCAYHMRQYVREHPPAVSDKLAITKYVCELHNEVNTRLGKDTYDCDPMLVLKRWHPGYPNKMEDRPSLEEQIAAEEAKMAEDAMRRRREQEKQEARLSVFGWQPGKGRRDPESWRATSDGAFPEARQETSDVGAALPAHEAVAKTPTRWWFFSGSAYGGKGESASTATSGGTGNTVPVGTSPPSATATARSTGAGSGASRPPKAADSETDVDAVLARLRGCQVYCPEDETIAGSRTLAK